MEYLNKLTISPEISYYEIKGDKDMDLERYVISTPETRMICNVPEIVGVRYTSLMEKSMISALKNLPGKESLLVIPQRQFCVFTFLRGGLNFGLREALYHAYGFNNHASSFLTSQRYMADGKWIITENQYRKLKVPDNATLLIGDVVATGVTLEQGFMVFLDYLRSNRIRLDNLLFFTIGSDNSDRIMEEVDRRLRLANPSYGRTIVVYVEGKFRVADVDTHLRIKIPGTDLLRTDALLAPEFALSQYEDVAYPLERCTIYDAGSRSFDVPEYMHDVLDYWGQMKKLAERGFTLYEAMKERWPETGWEDLDRFLEDRNREWRGVDEHLLTQLHGAFKGRWDDRFIKTSKTNKPLIELCNKRIEQISK